MSAEYFLDTNILLYGFDKTDPRKKQIAETLVEQAAMSGIGVISSQVCQEFCNVMLHKNADGIPLDKLAAYLEAVVFGLIRVYPSPGLFREALRIHEETQYRFYDSLIIAAALESKAPILYSEDLQHDRRIGSLRIINPFL
jgi:predicted nucleic acid-binding protein